MRRNLLLHKREGSEHVSEFATLENERIGESTFTSAIAVFESLDEGESGAKESATVRDVVVCVCLIDASHAENATDVALTDSSTSSAASYL